MTDDSRVAHWTHGGYDDNGRVLLVETLELAAPDGFWLWVINTGLPPCYTEPLVMPDHERLGPLPDAMRRRIDQHPGEGPLTGGDPITT